MTTTFCQATTFPSLLREAASLFGENPALSLTGEDTPEELISFAGLERQSAVLARGLAARGVGKGCRIGFICGNGPLFALWLAAITRIGAVAIPVSTLLKANELVRVLRHADLHGLLVQRKFLGNDYAARLCEALPGLAASDAPDLRLPEVPFLRWIATSGGATPASIRDLSWITDAAVSFGEDMLQQIEAEVHAADQFVEIYTSGSMALPKGVKHLHGPAMFRARYLARETGRQPGTSANASLPMFWIGGMGMFLLPGLVSGSLTVCTEATLANSQFAMGSVIPEESLALLAQQPKPWWGLGMSETFGPYTQGNDFRAPGHPVCAPMDIIADGYQVRVVDEHNQSVSEGEIGEMQVRGYALTPALHKIEREGYFTDDGFYHTGDLVKVDGSRLHFVGRDGDMIKTNGSNVSPAEVEMELQRLPGILSAYVIGLPDEQRGQLVAAAVVARDGFSPLDEIAIAATLKQRLSSYKVPRAFLELALEEVPMLPSNKVARREIARMIAERLKRV